MSFGVNAYRYCDSSIKAVHAALILLSVFLLYSCDSHAIGVEEVITPCVVGSDKAVGLVGRKHLVIVSGSYKAGLGDVTYGVQVFQQLKKHFPGNNFTLVLYGHESYEEKVRTLFGFDQNELNDFIWVSQEAVKGDDPSQGEKEAFDQLGWQEKEEYLRQYIQNQEENELYLAIDEAIKNAAWKKLQKQSSGTVCTLVAAIAAGGADGETGLTFLEEKGLAANISMENMNYPDSPTRYDVEAGLRAMLGGMTSGSRDIQKYLNEFFYDFWLSAAVLEAEQGEDEASEDINYTPPPGWYEFGHNPDRSAESQLGFMLSEELKGRAEGYEGQSEAGKAFIRQHFFKEQVEGERVKLKGIKDSADQLLSLVEGGRYFFGYMQNDFSLLEFMSGTAPLEDPENDLTYVINFSRSYLNRAAFRNELFKHVMTINNVSRVVYWSGEVREEIYSNSDGNRTLWIINPFTLDKTVMENMIMMSAHSVAGCTGDHSLYDVISLNKIPFHEEVPHLYGLHQQFSDFSRRLGGYGLAGFFETFSPALKADSLRSADMINEWREFRDHLWNNHNASRKMLKIFAPLLGDRH